jgi:putative ABC transport system permease protein
LYLAWRYLRFQRWKTMLLVFSITLVLFLPAALYVLVSKSSKQLTARAEATPLVLGAKGSELELVLHALYFETNRPPLLTMAAVDRINGSALASSIPIYARYSAPNNWRIVGTTLDYFQFRGLRLSAGRTVGLLGECVVGADVARDLRLQPGSTIVSTPETFFDLAGVYPLKMHVVGLLAATGGPDDRASGYESCSPACSPRALIVL